MPLEMNAQTLLDTDFSSAVFAAMMIAFKYPSTSSHLLIMENKHGTYLFESHGCHILTGLAGPLFASIATRAHHIG
jgi:hypothetical protein